MIILDTNVLSELARRTPNEDVVAWLDSLPPSEVATTAITAAELLYGVARLPVGRRKTELADTVRSVLEDEFHGRVEPFDVAAAGHLAVVVSTRDATGRPISVADAQIAAVCRKLRATLATRNVKDFEGAGIAVIDPWDSDRARN